jgi:hypothetical protein
MNANPTFEWTDVGAARYEFWVNQVGGPIKFIYEPALTTNSYRPFTALPNGQYDVWVRPLAADGEAGLWSPRFRFQMDYRIGPLTVAPIGITTDSTPTFRWQAIDGAARYDLWVDNVTTGAKQVIRLFVNHVPGAKEITYTPTQALTAADYRWWVQAVGPDGRRTAWSLPTNFNVPVPTIVAPRGLINTNLPNFVWRGVTQYVRYDLWVDNLTTGQKQVIRIQDLVGTSYQTVLPLENGTFRAWLRAFDKDNNASQWSGNADFTINVGVGDAPTLLGPSGASGTRPTFRWTAGTRAVTYEILVKDMSQPSQPIVLNQRGIQGTTFQPAANLVAGKTYRWWVRGLDAGGNGLPWSQPLDFRVVSSDVPVEPASDLPLVATFDISSVITTSLTTPFDDGFRSVSAHTTGVVLQLDPAIAAADAAGSESAAAEPVAAIDELMAEYFAPGSVEGLLGFEELPAALPAPEAIPVPAMTSAEQTPDRRSSARVGVFAMLAGLVVSRKIRRNEDEEGSGNS